MEVMASIRNYIVLSCSRCFGDSVGGTVGASVDAFVGLHHWCIGRVNLVVPATRLRDMCIEL